MPEPIPAALAEVLAVAKPDETIVVRVPATSQLAEGLELPPGSARVLIVAEDCGAEAVPGSVADELHRLHGENDRLRAALTEIRDSRAGSILSVPLRDIARKALAGDQP